MTTLLTSLGEQSHDRLARRIVARLAESTDDLPNDISERLKVARNQALAKRKRVQLQTAPSVVAVGGGGAALTGADGDDGLWTRLGSFIPLIALIAGMLVITVVQEQHRANELAFIDVELLADELPPSAYMDPGFVHFLHSNRQD